MQEKISILEIEHISKESNNLGEIEVIGVSSGDYVVYNVEIDKKLGKIILNLTNSDTKQIRISRTELYYLKKRIREGKRIRINKTTLKKLFNI